MVIIGVLAAGIILWGSGAQARAREAACQSNLHQIALGLQLYADDHGGRLPPDGSEPVLALQPYLKNWQLMRCVDDRDPEMVEHDGAKDAVSYFVRSGLWSDDLPSTIVAGDTAARHRGRWNAACLDGRTCRLPASELPEALPKREGGDEH
jgi:type II secretory pathway pseudopilin PulG